MTTYQELSTCTFANRRIHNELIRQAIGFLRDAIRNQHSRAYKVLIEPRKRTLIKAIKERREQNYLQDTAKIKCGVCTYCESQRLRLKHGD